MASFAFSREKWGSFISDVFDQLHAMPEPSWQEIKTTAWLTRRLKKMGYHADTFNDCTGVVGLLGKGPFTVALRADMDALAHQTKSGERLIHSCGHDAHMAMVLTAAAALREQPLPPGIRLKLIFQPAEEKGQGALHLIERGVLDDVAFLFGVHLRPIQELPGGKAAPAIQNGAANFLHGRIEGVNAHGARPHLGINVIEAAADLIKLLQGIHWDPLQPASIKMTRLTAGNEMGNIIPDHAVFTLDVRAQTNQHMSELVRRVENITSCVAQASGATIHITPGTDTPAAENSNEAVDIMSQAITDTMGADSWAPPVLTPGAEDFHYYTRQRPAIKATMLGLGCNLQPGLHHPEMFFEHNYLLDGAEILARAVWYACCQA